MGIKGLIVDYDHVQRAGYILLHHRNDPDFSLVISDYLKKHQASRPFWFAKFNWFELSEELQRRVYELTNMKIRRKGVNDGTKQLLVGRRVICQVRRQSCQEMKWTALVLEIDFVQASIHFTKMRRDNPLTDTVPQTPCSGSAAKPLDRRIERKNIRAHSNILHPFQG